MSMLKIVYTGIPRLTQFYIARFPIARIFEVVQENLHSTVLYLKIYSVMQIFLDSLKNSCYGKPCYRKPC